MSKIPTTTRNDIDDVLQVLDVMITEIDERFNKTEVGLVYMQEQIFANS